MADKQATKPATKAEPKAKAFTLIKNQADLNKAITSIANRSAKLDHDIHVAAVSCIVHTSTHNDPDVTKRLIQSLGKSARRQALVAWILNYGAFSQDEAGELVYVKARSEQVLSKENVDAAIAEPFWDFAGPEQAYRQFDLKKALAAVLAKAEKAITAPQQDSSLIQPDALAELRRLAGLEAANAAAVAASHTPT